jgi:hypothetical protein
MVPGTRACRRPPGGFGSQLGVMQGWLHANLGREGYFFGADADARQQGVMPLYFFDVYGARAFVDRFACGMVLLPSPRPEDRPW